MAHFGFDAPTTTERLRTIAPPLLEAGFDWIEVEDLSEHSPAYWRALDEVVARYGPRLSVHCEYRHLAPAAQDPELRDAALAVIRRGIDLAVRLGADVAVMHGGECDLDGLPPEDHPLRPLAMQLLSASREQHHHRLRQVLPALADYAVARGVRLTIENLFLPWHLLRSPEEMAGLLDDLDGQAGACLDVGHAHVAGFAPQAFLQALGNRIWHLHVHGNDGLCDSHRPLAQCDDALARSLPPITSANPEACLLFELNLSHCSVPEILADRELAESLL
jgi:sugar phosphate isomerase/epimerase